jgi:adenylate kinase
MGPPGVGKGTQAKGIAEHYQIPAISTGDMFRAMKGQSTELAKEVQALMDAGQYVPDEVTDRIVVDRLGKEDAQNGWLLDGYPRTIGQVHALDKYLEERGQKLDAVISLVADEETVKSRLLKRAAIEGRSDDNAETIAKRMKVYHEATDPLLDVYKERGLLIEVNGEGSVETVDERIRQALDKLS